METLTTFARIPKFFKKIFPKDKTFRGDIWFIGGSIYAFFVIIIASILHYVSNPFTMFSHWVSNLGIGPNGSTPVFNFGLMGTAVLYFVMAIYTFVKFKGISKITDTLLKISTILGITAVVGIFILTNNVMGTDSPLHVIGAYMFFVCTPFFTSLITVVFEFTEKKDFRIHKIVSIAYVIISIMMLPASAISAYILNIPSNEMLGSSHPGFAVARIIEWSALFLFFAWIFVTGLMMHQNKNFPELH
jgi:hypothetical membrane protein